MTPPRDFLTGLRSLDKRSVAGPHQTEATSAGAQVSRRAVLGGVAAASFAVAEFTGSAPASAASAAENGASYLVGRGVTDTTGPAAENGMMGYSMPQQISAGIHMRLKARAFVIVDSTSKRCIAWCVAEQALIPVAAHAAVVERLGKRLPGVYDLHTVNVTATHTHSTPGGCSHDLTYNLAILGFQQQTFDAMADGIVEAIVRAHRDARPGGIRFGRTELHDASVNRSKKAFDANTAADKAHYPQAIDPAMLVMRFTQGGRDVGMISWYSTHGTSLPNTNLLVSSDNKGYAAYAWEKALGQDPLDPAPNFVAAFAQTNSGDMSPNLNLKPGSGPTGDPFENVRIIGQRQHDAARTAWASASGEVTGSIQSATRYVNLAKIAISGEFTSDGKASKTSPAVLGLSMLAGSTEDGPGIPVPEGATDPLGKLLQRIPRDTPAWLQADQAPKVCAVPSGLVDASPSWAAIHLLKLGQFWFVCPPAEITIVAGLRLRQQIAAAVGAPLENVLVQGYTNGYTEYVATPEEYDVQDYEGASTLYGKWTLCAYQQEFTKLAKEMLAGGAVNAGRLPAPSPLGKLNLVLGVVYDNPPIGKKFGQALTQPAAKVTRGATASAVFVTGHPKNDLRLGGTYFEVQRKTATGWQRVRCDADFDTRYHWKRKDALLGSSEARLEWMVPKDAEPGTYRFVHHGNAKAPGTGRISAFDGTSAAFTVA